MTFIKGLYQLVFHLNFDKLISFFFQFKIANRKSTLPQSVSSKLKPYHHDFSDSIHKVQTTEELKNIVFMLLINKLGPFIHHDVLLMIKIVRIGKSLMCSNESNDIKYDLIQLLDECILPALSFVDSNYGLSEGLYARSKICLIWNKLIRFFLPF